MNILFITPFDLVHQRLWGPSARIFHLAKEFKRMKHEVFFAGGEPYKGEKVDKKEGVPFIYLPTFPMHRYPYDEKSREELKKLRRPFTNIRTLWLSLKKAVAIYSICKRKNIELIYLGRTFPESAIACWLVKKLAGIPVVVDWDDVEGLFGFASSQRIALWKQQLYSFCETYFAARADAVVVASKFLYEFSLDIGVSPERLFYARTAGDHTQFVPDANGLPLRKNPKSPTLLYAGNLRSENGVKVENIIYTFAEVKKKIPKAELLVLGGGDLLETKGKPGILPSLAKKLKVSSSVEFAGDVPYSEMPKHLKRADLCLALFPVNVITMAKSPIKIYEYMCAGKPVIARAVGEISECITDGENGFLVHTDSLDEYADKIVKALSDPEKLERIGTNARKTVEDRFNWTVSAKEAIKACGEALKKPEGR